MAFPPIQKTWTISPNNAIADLTLLAMMANYLLQVANFLLANGYTCKGSSNGVTGAMDAVNRWVTVADTAIRGANVTTAQSWMVLTDGNGCDLCLAYEGASDSIARISYSPGGLYVAAATGTHTPTATDELIMASATSVIGTTAATTPRVLFMWADSEAKLCRCLLTLDTANAPTGITWGLELLDSTLQDRAISPSVWGFAYTSGEFQISNITTGFAGAFSQSVRGGRSRVNASALNLTGGSYQFISSWQAIQTSTQTELQGTSGYPIWGPLRVGSATAGFTGLTANLIDWWSCRAGAPAICGDTYDNLNYMAVGTAGGLLWPWDGVTTPDPGNTAVVAQPGQHTGFENDSDPAYGSFMNVASMYVPLANSRVTPTPVATPPTSIARRPGVQVIRLAEMPTDPPAEPGRTLLYWRTISGQPALFARYANGDVFEVGAG